MDDHHTAARLRGDLSKWLTEINTGVYVGQLNQRVRDALWKRICDNFPKGRATMVYSANNEQRMAFRVHSTTWQPVDFEGLTLMRRPLCAASNDNHVPEPSKAAISQMTRRRQTANAYREKKAGYVVVDIETTGLDCEKDKIRQALHVLSIFLILTQNPYSLIRVIRDQRVCAYAGEVGHIFRGIDYVLYARHKEVSGRHSARRTEQRNLYKSSRPACSHSR